MKKKVFGRKLSRDKNERKALFKGLISALVLKETIQTTEGKAKAIKSEVEKLVTKAKQGDISAKTVLEKNLSRSAFEKMLKDIAPRFANRQGGYIRLIKLGKRFGDNASMALIEWSEKASAVAVVSPKEAKKKEVKQKTVKKIVKKVVKKETKKKVTKLKAK